jgi:hypothetical protein
MENLYVINILQEMDKNQNFLLKDEKKDQDDEVNKVHLYVLKI